MLVNVGNLEANPYRKIDKYPIRREKVEQLKASIGETGFWDNILARPKPEHTKVLTRMVFNDDTGEEEYDPYGDGPEILIGPPADETTDESDIVEAFIPGIYGDSVSDDNYYQQPIIQIAYGHHRLAAIRELGIEEVDIPVKDIDDRTMIKIMANENMEDWETNTAVINETVLTVMEFITSEFAEVIPGLDTLKMLWDMGSTLLLTFAIYEIIKEAHTAYVDYAKDGISLRKSKPISEEYIRMQKLAGLS